MMIIQKVREVELYLLFKVCSGCRNLGQVLIEQIFLCSQAVVLYVCGPVEGAGVKVEFLKQNKTFLNYGDD